MIEPDRCTSEAAAHPLVESFPARHTRLGAIEIRRALPLRERRMVGAWCFLDRYGPLTFAREKPMDLGPHPHIGLQTVSWLVEGEVLHHDSLGYESLIRPGELNLMTAGRGIAHAEETPRQPSGRLSGVQLWIAMPEESRNGPAGFEHHHDLPRETFRDGHASVLIGSVGSARSAATDYSPIVGAEVFVGPGGRIALPLDRSFEHALFVLDGTALLDGALLTTDVLYYLGTGRDELELAARESARLLLLGGAPFGETILMWWNFVARTPEEIVVAREEWARHERFGEVHGYDGPRIDAPALLGRVRPPAAS